ncbi:transcriptional regulator with XRE-family HTH domain [Nocardiopsis sp. Huas11]|uniref:helix-turn-helix domain-containing protein n=1 Tax=Nocardiopsis sp. Huas11 TaxID=2183912 RepID=UPI000EB4D9DA|nr:helix-turn-helix transcriptional regulator [Nocardiopsis sp. Huas11]RKS04991.1 transcriptional regulator with XRE-family HTH domain [Nocardiopsis sp. Huas11]
MADSVKRKWIPFGKEVRRLRNEQGLSLAQVGKRLGVTGSLVGQIERATRAPKRPYVDKLDDLFETNGELINFWVDTQREGRVHEDFRSALALERKAAQIREYQSILFPGLIQTPDYARVLIKARNPQASLDEVEDLVTARMARLGELRDRKTTLWFVVDEAVVHRPIGSSKILSDQLQWILQLVESGTIRFQALPLTRHPGLCAPFRVVSLDKRRMVLYAEHAVGGEILESLDLVNETLTLFSAMQAEALSSQATIELISKAKENHERAGLAHVDLH